MVLTASKTGMAGHTYVSPRIHLLEATVEAGVVVSLWQRVCVVVGGVWGDKWEVFKARFVFFLVKTSILASDFEYISISRQILYIFQIIPKTIEIYNIFPTEAQLSLFL